MKKTFLLVLLTSLLLATQVPLQDSKTLDSIKDTPPSNLLQNRFWELTFGVLCPYNIPHLRFGVIKPLNYKKFFLKPTFGTTIIFHTFELPLIYKVTQKLSVGPSLCLCANLHPYGDASFAIELGIQCCTAISNSRQWTIRLYLLPTLYHINSGPYDENLLKGDTITVNNCIGISSNF